MTDLRAQRAPAAEARIAGLFYLLVFVIGIFTLFVWPRIVVAGDAAATAQSIMAHQPLLRIGFAADLLVTICYVVVTALFYGLFKPVNKSVSLVAAFLSLVGCATQALAAGLHLAPLSILGRAPFLSSFDTAQLQALALLCFRLYAVAYNVGIVFFGFYCLLIGYLVFRSTFIPRVIGALMMFAGLGWLTFLSPSLAAALSPYNLLPGIIGEGSLTLWLLIKGIDVGRWMTLAEPGLQKS
jgi:Domain of unknown function (DUF4386)